MSHLFSIDFILALVNYLKSSTEEDAICGMYYRLESVCRNSSRLHAGVTSFLVDNRPQQLILWFQLTESCFSQGPTLCLPLVYFKDGKKLSAGCSTMCSCHTSYDVGRGIPGGSHGLFVGYPDSSTEP